MGWFDEVIIYSKDDTGKRMKVTLTSWELRFALGNLKDLNALAEFLDILNRWEDE